MYENVPIINWPTTIGWGQNTLCPNPSLSLGDRPPPFVFLRHCINMSHARGQHVIYDNIENGVKCLYTSCDHSRSPISDSSHHNYLIPGHYIHLQDLVGGPLINCYQTSWCVVQGHTNHEVPVLLVLKGRSTQWWSICKQTPRSGKQWSFMEHLAISFLCRTEYYKRHSLDQTTRLAVSVNQKHTICVIRNIMYII